VRVNQSPEGGEKFLASPPRADANIFGLGNQKGDAERQVALKEIPITHQSEKWAKNAPQNIGQSRKKKKAKGSTGRGAAEDCGTDRKNDERGRKKGNSPLEESTGEL